MRSASIMPAALMGPTSYGGNWWGVGAPRPSRYEGPTAVCRSPCVAACAEEIDVEIVARRRDIFRTMHDKDEVGWSFAHTPVAGKSRGPAGPKPRIVL